MPACVKRVSQVSGIWRINGTVFSAPVGAGDVADALGAPVPLPEKEGMMIPGKPIGTPWGIPVPGVGNCGRDAGPEVLAVLVTPAGEGDFAMPAVAAAAAAANSVLDFLPRFLDGALGHMGAVAEEELAAVGAAGKDDAVLGAEVGAKMEGTVVVLS